MQNENIPSLSDFSDKVLISNIKEIRYKEASSVAELVLFLSEIDSRKLYRELGFSSLYSYCSASIANGGLGYSEGSTFRRIQAARSLKTNPEIYGLLKEGKISLCAISEIAKVEKEEVKSELIKESLGKSKKEVQLLTLQYQEPVKASKVKERITPKKVIAQSQPLFESSSIEAETKFTFTVEVDQEFMDLLKEAKELTRVKPSVEIIKKTLKDYIKVKKSPPQKQSIPVAKNSRYIPKATKHLVKTRDNHQCSFVSEDGRRCTEKCGLHIDHIKPFALGGTNDASNLRLLCPCHNQYFAEMTFGKTKVESYLHSTRC